MDVPGTNDGSEESVSRMALYTLDRAHNTMSSLGHLQKWSNADTAPFDCMHYDGDKALEHCATTLGLQPLTPVGPSEPASLAGDGASLQKILDIGSGFSATGRYLATHYCVSVTGIELQTDIHNLAHLITSKNTNQRVRDRVRSMNANFLAFEPGFHNSYNVQKGSYDHVISVLCITHIPETSRPRFWHQAARFLKPDGRIYIEDFFQRGPLTEDEDWKMQNVMAGSYVPTREQFIEEVEAAGFEGVEFEDVSEEWTGLLVRRAGEYRSKVEGDRDEDLRVFYDTVAEVFAGGHVGGVRLNAVLRL